MVDPCCSFVSPQKGAIFMGYLSILRAFGCLLFTSIFLVVYILKKELVFNALDTIGLHIHFVHLEENIVIGMSIFLMLVFVIEFPLYSSATIFALRENKKRCSYWWKLKCFLLGISLVVGIIFIILSKDRIILGIICVIVLIYDLYLIWVIKYYAELT